MKAGKKQPTVPMLEAAYYRELEVTLMAFDDFKALVPRTDIVEQLETIIAPYRLEFGKLMEAGFPSGWQEYIDRAFSAPQPEPSPPKEFIYLTRSDFGCKIGRTVRPGKRPLSVAGNMPIKLEVLVVIEVPDAIEAERRLHQYFRDKKLRGEWFALDVTDVELVKGFPASFEGLDAGEDIPF